MKAKEEEFTVDLVISDDYKKLIKKEVNEILIGKIMNMSKKIFPDKYEFIEEQSNNESDFKNISKDEFFDAKVLFSQDICYMIDKGKVKEWLISLAKGDNQFNESIVAGNGLDIEFPEISLYREFKARLLKINSFENCIFFVPFPSTLELEDSIMSYISSNMYRSVMNNLIKNEYSIIRDKEIYMIYPNLENQIVLSKLFDGKKAVKSLEFLKISLLHQYIKVSNINFKDKENI